MPRQDTRREAGCRRRPRHAEWVASAARRVRDVLPWRNAARDCGNHGPSRSPGCATGPVPGDPGGQRLWKVPGGGPRGTRSRDSHCRPSRVAPAAFVASSAALLAAATVLALATLGAAVAVTDPSAGATLEALSRFTAAANAAIAGAGPAALADVLAPGADIRLNGMPPVGEAGFAAALAEVGRAGPGLRLSLHAVAFGDGWAIARMAVDGGARPTDEPIALRLEDGRVAEVWGGPDFGSLPRALPPVRLPPWGGQIEIALARITLPSESTLPEPERADMRLVLAEAGTVEVVVGGPALLYGRDAGGDWRGPAVSTPIVLQHGDAVLVGPSAALAVRNRDDRTATLLALVARRVGRAPAAGQGGVAAPSSAFAAAGVPTAAAADILAAVLVSPDSSAAAPALLEVIVGDPEPHPGRRSARGTRLVAPGDAARNTVVVALSPAPAGLPADTPSLGASALPRPNP